METFPFSDQMGKRHHLNFKSYRCQCSSVTPREQLVWNPSCARSLCGCVASRGRIPRVQIPGAAGGGRSLSTEWEPSARHPGGATPWRYSKLKNPPAKPGLEKEKPNPKPIFFLLENTKKKYEAISQLEFLNLFPGEEKATYCKKPIWFKRKTNVDVSAEGTSLFEVAFLK